MDCLGFQSGGFCHSLGCPSRRRCQQYAQSKGTVCSDNSLGCGGLSSTRTTSQYQNLRSGRPPDRLCLNLVIFHIYSLLDLLHINRQLRIAGFLSGSHQRYPEPVSCRFLGKFLQFIGNTHLCVIKWRQINAFSLNLFCCIFRNNLIRRKLRNHDLLANQFLIFQHLIHGHNDTGVLRLQKLRCLPDQLFTFRINMTFIC